MSTPSASLPLLTLTHSPQRICDGDGGNVDTVIPRAIKATPKRPTSMRELRLPVGPLEVASMAHGITASTFPPSPS